MEKHRGSVDAALENAYTTAKGAYPCGGTGDNATIQWESKQLILNPNSASFYRPLPSDSIQQCIQA